MDTEALIIGAGPGGYVAAIKLGKLGKATELAEGATPVSFWLAVALSFVLFLIAGVCWISAAINSRK